MVLGIITSRFALFVLKKLGQRKKSKTSKQSGMKMEIYVARAMGEVMWSLFVKVKVLLVLVLARLDISFWRSEKVVVMSDQFAGICLIQERERSWMIRLTLM